MLSETRIETDTQLQIDQSQHNRRRVVQPFCAFGCSYLAVLLAILAGLFQLQTFCQIQWYSYRPIRTSRKYGYVRIRVTGIRTIRTYVYG